MAFTAVLCFGTCSAPLDIGAKMPPASPWRAYKRREAAGEYRGTGGCVGRLGGHKKARPRLPQGGRWWNSRFFRRLPDNHQGKGKNKQDDQEAVTSFNAFSKLYV